METNKHIDQRLAESIRIALRDFGEGILMENRMMGVLKDYQGFWDFPQGNEAVKRRHTLSYRTVSCEAIPLDRRRSSAVA